MLLVFPYFVSTYTNDITDAAPRVIILLLLVVGFNFELGKKALKINSKQLKTALFYIKENLFTYAVFINSRSCFKRNCVKILIIYLLGLTQRVIISKILGPTVWGYNSDLLSCCLIVSMLAILDDGFINVIVSRLVRQTSEGARGAVLSMLPPPLRNGGKTLI